MGQFLTCCGVLGFVLIAANWLLALAFVGGVPAGYDRLIARYDFGFCLMTFLAGVIVTRLEALQLQPRQLVRTPQLNWPPDPRAPEPEPAMGKPEPIDREAEAARYYEKARDLIRAGNKQSAKDVVEWLIKEYPETAAAKKAAEVLKSSGTKA